jgi:hypothetical protein
MTALLFSRSNSQAVRHVKILKVTVYERHTTRVPENTEKHEAA